MTQRHAAILWFLVLGLVVTAGLAVKVELDKRTLAAAYQHTQQALQRVETERAQLDHELTEVRDALGVQNNDLASLQAELSRLQTNLQHTEQEVTQLRLEQTGLRQANEGLSQQVESLKQEKLALETKLSSLNDLKLAIREVKRKLWSQRWQLWLAHVQARREDDQHKLAQGNQGFVVRNGIPTLGAVTKLQVRVLEPQTQ